MFRLSPINFLNSQSLSSVFFKTTSSTSRLQLIAAAALGGLTTYLFSKASQVSKETRTTTLSDGTFETNEYENGKLSGTSKKTFPCGTFLNIEYKDGKKNGAYVYLSPKGVFEISEYKDDKLNGTCIKTSRESNILFEEYEDGKLNGTQKTIYPLRIAEIEYKDGKENGTCKIRFADGILGTLITRECKDGESIGATKYTLPDGTVFTEEDIDGATKYTLPDGTVFTGEDFMGITLKDGRVISPKELKQMLAWNCWH